MTLYYVTANNLCFCNTWQNGETRKSHFFYSNALLVETTGRTCNQGMGCVAMATQRGHEMLASTCLYSLNASN